MTQLDTLPPSEMRRPGRPVGSDSAQTRARILAVARRQIATRGYPATTFQALATGSGFSRTTLHYYFDSLDAIYQTLMADASSVVVRCITMASMESTLPDRLAAYLSEFSRMTVSDRESVALLVSSRLTSSRAPAPAYDPAVDLRAFLSQSVTDAIDRGELPADTSVVVLVDLLYSLLWGVGFYASFVDDGARLELVTAQLGNSLRFGLLKGDA